MVILKKMMNFYNSYDFTFTETAELLVNRYTFSIVLKSEWWCFNFQKHIEGKLLNGWNVNKVLWVEHLDKTKTTYFPSRFSSSATTGFMLSLGLGLPSGRPRWDMRITALAPFSKASLTVGRAAAILENTRKIGSILIKT